MFQRPSDKRLSGMSKLWLDNEIGISKSSCLLDGLYRNTLPEMLLIVKVSGNAINIPFSVFVKLIFSVRSFALDSLLISF